MKKKLLILFTFYFFLTSVGVVFGSHYCGKKVSYSVWNIPVSVGKSCACDHNEKSEHKDKCCKDISKWVKAKSDVSKVQAIFQFNFATLSQILLKTSIFTFSGGYAMEHLTYTVSHPPPLPGISIYLRKCSLLI